ncbi:YbjN domain-containing protein [Plantactinospora sp. CA-294935]|uniref:YbjN domain-containing protein n=1 Tax=Plantactinospora sp. CA-294935 TaxID=3240012 RepID=UPI003D8D3A00
MTRDELFAALADARDRPDDAAKVAELDRIVAHADAGGDVGLGFAARLALVEVHRQVEPWRMLPPVRWCLDVVDQAPGTLDAVDSARLHGYHREAVAALCGTSRIGLTRAGAALDDLERRLGAAGRSCGPAYALRCRIADHVGAESTARRWLVRWRAAPRDEWSGCGACEPAEQARLLTGWGRWTEAVELVEPVLAGTLRCPDQPERALGTIQLAYLRLGRYDEAAAAHVRAYRRHRRERAGFPFLADHLRFCALTGHYDRGLEILARHLPELDRPYDEASALEFAAAGALLCRLAGPAGFARHLIHRPGYAGRHAAELTVTALGTELTATAEDLAGRFDARNGTSHQSGRIASWLAERPLPGPVRLPPEPVAEPERAIEPEPPATESATTAEPESANQPEPTAKPEPATESATAAESTTASRSEPAAEPRTKPEPPTGPTTAARPTTAGRWEPVPVGCRDRGDGPAVVAPLTVAAIVEVLRDRADQHVLGPAGTVGGRWGNALIEFQRLGERGEILHARVTAERRLPAERLGQAYEFCNAWNQDQLLPKAYVLDLGAGELVLAGDVSTDLEYGVAAGQLAVLVNATLASGAAFAAAVAALP